MSVLASGVDGRISVKVHVIATAVRAASGMNATFTAYSGTFITSIMIIFELFGAATWMSGAATLDERCGDPG